MATPSLKRAVQSYVTEFPESSVKEEPKAYWHGRQKSVSALDEIQLHIPENNDSERDITKERKGFFDQTADDITEYNVDVREADCLIVSKGGHALISLL